jgi:hypothetical protein
MMMDAQPQKLGAQVEGGSAVYIVTKEGRLRRPERSLLSFPPRLNLSSKSRGTRDLHKRST